MNDLRKAILYRIKRSANKRKLECNLDIDDITIPSHCTLLGCELTHSVGHAYVPTHASVDRVDSTKGYVKGNIQIISQKANTMKSNATPDELITFAINILRQYAPHRLAAA